MSHKDDPYSEVMLAEARREIAAAHGDALSIGQDCYDKLCHQLAGVEYEVETAEEAAFALSARILELSAMALLCLRSGSVPAAKILTRSILESSYKVCAIRADPKNVEQFTNDEIAARLLLNKKIHEYKKDKGSKTVAKGIEKQIDKLVAKKAQKIDPSEWSIRAEMVDFHRLFYPWLSSDIHGNAAAVDHYFDPQRDYALQIGPTDIDLRMSVMILSRCLVAVLRVLDSTLSEPPREWLTAIEKRLQTLEAS